MISSAVHSTDEVVTYMCFISYQGKEVLVSASGDGTVVFWDHANSMERLMTLSHHKHAVNDILALPEYPHLLFTASDDHTIAVWDVAHPASPIHIVRGFGEAINKVISLPQGVAPEAYQESLLLLSGCDDGMVYIHSLSADFTQSCVLDRFWVSMSTVNDLIFYDGVLLTGSEDNAVRSWRLLFQPGAPTEQRLIESLDEFNSTINHMCLIPPETLSPPPPPPVEVMEEDRGVGGSSPALPLLPAATAPGVWLFVACAEMGFGTDFYGSSVCTGGLGGIFGKAVKTFEGHRDYIRGMHITKEKTLYTVADDCTLIEWRLESGDMIRKVKLHDAIIMSSAISEGKDLLATGTVGGEIRLWQLPFQTEVLGSFLNPGSG